MVKFVSTAEISACIEKIIKNSKRKLTIISAYNFPSDSFFELLSDADNRGVKITFIYGKKSLDDNVKKKFFGFKNIQIFYCSPLHAKCYFNEETLIITSMNLIGKTEKSNKEMGVVIEKKDSLKTYNDVVKEVKLIIKESKKEKSFGIELLAMYEHLLFIDKEYSYYLNFHLPSLKEILIKKYPQKKISLDKVLKIEDFPSSGINCKISYNICIVPEKVKYYEKVRSYNEGVLESKLKKNKLVWGKKQLSIYTGDGYKPEKSIQGLKIYLKKIVRVIDTIQVNLKV